MASASDLRENQRGVRAANERFEALLAAESVRDDLIVPFLCECADAGCLGRVEMTTAAYDESHLDRDQYVVLHEHPRVEGEELVVAADGYDVVRKTS